MNNFQTIWPIDMTLADTTTQGKTGSRINEEVQLSVLFWGGESYHSA